LKVWSNPAQVTIRIIKKVACSLVEVEASGLSALTVLKLIVQANSHKLDYRLMRMEELSSPIFKGNERSLKVVSTVSKLRCILKL
jgi:hypothetical protein